MIPGPGPAGLVVGRLAVGALIGASVWVSQGVLGLVDPVRLTRVAAVPGWPWLAGFAAGGAALMTLAKVPARAWPPLVALTLLWLPWLPFRVPAAFLLWEGPLEVVVWLSALGGVAWLCRHDVTWPWRAPAIPASRAPWTAALLSLLIFCSAWLVARPRVPSGDEPHYLVITQSLLRDGDLRIENNHQAHQYLDYYDGELRPDFRRRGLDRQIYSIHAPGVSALVAPAFAVAGYPGAVFTVIAVVSLGLALLWRAAFVLTGSAAAAWLAWAVLTASAPFLLHAFTIYPDGPGAAALIAGVLALVWLEAGAMPQRPVAWTAVGTALACLPWIHTRFALVAGVVGAALCARLMRRPHGLSTIARLLVVPVLAAAAWFLYFWVIYGTPNPAVVYGASENVWSAVGAGLTGLLADQQFGLVPNAPVLGAGLLGLVAMARRRPRLAAELTAILGSYLLAVATYPMWWGGSSAPGRFAVVVLPVLALAVAEWWAAARSARGAIVALLLVSAAISLALVAVDRGAFIYNGRDGYDLLLDWLSPTVNLPVAAPSVHRDGVAATLEDAAIWLAVASAVAAGVAWLARVRPDRAVTRMATALAVPTVAMLAATLVWAGLDRPALTPATSQMGFLHRWSPSRLPFALQLAPTRVLAAADVPRRLTLASTTRALRPASGEPLLRIPRVLAGEYDVYVDGRASLAGTLTVGLGRQRMPMETWSLAGRHSGFTGLTLSLPTHVHSVTISGDDAAVQAVSRLTLKPRVVEPPERARESVRAERFGHVIVFALDDNAYMEPAALWIRGGRTARFVARADDGAAAVLRLQAGAVANTVTVAGGGWSTTVTLAPGETAEVPVPAAALAPAELTVTSATGFRPIDYDARSHDGRVLGVYVTWPDPPR